MKKICIVLFTVFLAVSLNSYAMTEKNYPTAKIEIYLHGLTPGITVGSIDITIDYNQSRLSYIEATAGSLSAGSTLIANDSKDVVRVGLIHAQGFDGGAKGSVMTLTFKVIDGHKPSIGDFTIKRILVTDLSGKNLHIDLGKASLSLCS